ncbi:hypothetical protein J7T55_012502 [Diaporthe amygdali]|uniref:uncharacterized protein n=1 Tax=Phomopsis amygdali TaxID=1214568 RepID=UPI0022FEE55C|nr:uncharacterized protein J7T55_012502 [Diaporthe amygdali]KAJ0124029.1 hypothetical protein J7T55_012502 [Diaporthe amygdali]
MSAISRQAKGLVVVTGANGFIAGQVILSLLSSGYAVRGTIRSLERCQHLQSAESPFHPYVLQGLFSLAEVPDLTSPTQVAAAFTDATAVAHLAQPVLFSTDADYVIGTAVRGTQIALEAAAQIKSVKSFVLMSSVSAVRMLLSNPAPPGHVITADEWDDADFKIKTLQAEGKPLPGPLVYAASKAAGERALWEFVKLNKPGFATTAINPVFVAGPSAVPPRTAADISGTTKFIFDLLAGKDLPPPERLVGYGAYVDVRDVARLVSFAIGHSEVADGHRFLAVSSWVHPQGVVDVLRKAYPDRHHIIQEGTPGEGYMNGFGFPHSAPKFDTETAVKASGEGWIPFEDTILAAAQAYKNLL